MSTIKHITFALLLAFLLSFMLIGVRPAEGFASTGTDYPFSNDTGDNENTQNYLVYSHPSGDYLTATEDGYMRFDYRGDEYFALYYDKAFNFLEYTTIPAELEEFGGFYDGGDSYFIVTGKENSKYNDSVEVFRITKYTKDWQRVGSCGVYGGNTYEPFHSGNCRMAMEGKYLFIHTCHTMYPSNDGKNHQANVTIAVDTDRMEISDYEGDVGYSTKRGYVSHSFNQFIQIKDGALYTLDHGDAYPRAAVVMAFLGDCSDGTIPYSSDPYNVKEFYGDIGQNVTGASLGGFEVGEDHFLVALNEIPDTFESDFGQDRNMALYSVDIETGEVNVNVLTANTYTTNYLSTPQLVKVGDNRYMALWTHFDSVYYVLTNESAELLSSIYSFKGALSGCQPIVDDNKVIWYTVNGSAEKIYQIPIDQPEAYTILARDYHKDSPTPTPDDSSKAHSAGDTVSVSSGKVKITSVKGRTVSFTKAKNIKSVTVPATVTIDNKSYKVTQVAAKAFTGGSIRTVTIGKNVKVIKAKAFAKSKVSKIILKTKLLKKSTVKGSLKGSKVKTIKVNVGSKKLNKKYIKKYKPFFAKKNSGKKVNIT